MRYSREDGCRAWLAHAMIPPVRLRELLDAFGSAENVYDRFRATDGECLAEWATEKQRELLRDQAAQAAMHGMMLAMQRQEIGILSIGDELYPPLLREIADPPVFLFYRGDLHVLHERTITVVGTRAATPQGAAAAHDLARGLSENGVVVVSGLAAGIDTAAHEGCLAGGSPTVGVCGCGIDVDYPVMSHELKERIVEGGGVLLSEFPLGYPSGRWVFEIRNRILSGLSRGVVLVEGRRRSGALLTVRHALDQGRDVFAWPGVIGSECAEAAHDLLREGARFATTAADVLEDFGWDSAQLPTREEKAALPPLDANQQLIVNALRMGEQSMDQLVLATKLDTPTLGASLTLLQILGVIRALPGKSYALI